MKSFLCLISFLLALPCFGLFDDPFAHALTGTTAFIKCNESLQDELLDAIEAYPPPERALHIGWSIEFNYRIIVKRRPECALVCDISRKTFEFYDVFRECILECDFESFFEELATRVYEGKICRRVITRNRAPTVIPCSKKEVDDQLKTYPLWLDAEGFGLLKKMYRDGRIHHFYLNATDNTGEFDLLADWIREGGYKVDTVYTSNILSWLGRKKKRFYENLSKIFPSGILIYSEKKSQNHLDLLYYIQEDE